MASADEILEKAKKDAASRAGKTTEERLAEMKAARDAKLAEQAADRENKKANTPSKSEQAELDRNKKFAEERLAANPDSGAGGIIGSTITKWMVDPKTGKKRTPQEIVDAVTKAVLADKKPGGISIDPLTGKQQSLTPAQKVNQIMLQLIQNAKYEGKGLSEANEVYKYLQKGARKGTVDYLANQPELWSLGKDTVGTVIDRKQFDEPGSKKNYVLDPTKNQLTPEQLKTFKESGGLAIDPVTGFQVLIDDQGRYTVGDQPTPSGDTSNMDYSQYAPDFESLNYSLEGLSPESMGFNMGNGTGNVSGTGNISGTGYGTGSASSNLDVMKSILRGMGFNSKIIDSSSAFLNNLLKEGLDYDNAVSIFLNSQDYTLKNGTKIKSPFYEEYGYLNEGLTNPKTAAELYNAVEGYKGVAEKYGISPKFLTPDALKGYVKNNVTVADLAERAGTAQLRALESDPFQVEALIKQGFISSAANLTDFYLDPKIGKEQLELNRQTGVFTAEALRRAKSGISTSAAQLSRFKQLTATLASKGYSEAQIGQLAAQGFENISETLNPLTMYSQIYEKAGGTKASNEALQSGLQEELMGEQFLGTASGKRKKLSELATRSFEGRTGFYGGKSTTAGQI
jgi:hypothetical protein